MIWMLISFVMLFVGCTQGNTVLIIASGLYGIAGAIGAGSSIIRDAIKLLVTKREEKKTEEDIPDFLK